MINPATTLNNIIAIIPIPMAILDTNMQYLAVSGQWISFYELENNSYVGKSHYATFPNIDEKWKVLYSKALQGVDEQCKDNRYLHANGTEFWLNWEIKHWLAEDGSIGGIVIYFEDVTDLHNKKQLEEDLYQSETQLKQAFDYNLLGMALISPNGEWKKINNSLKEILGYTEAELQNTNVKDITHQDDIVSNNNLLKDLASGQIANVKVEKRYVHKNGSIIDVLVVATMLKDSQGKPLHFITQIEDITKRKNTEEKLLISEKKYRSIFKNFQDVYYQADNRGLITEISPSIEHYSGFSREIIMNQPVSNFYFYPEDREKFMLALHDKMAVIDFEVRLKTKEDKIIYASVNAHKIFENGVVTGIEGTLRDVTTRKFHEDTLKALNSELTASNELKNELLSIIGHDLRNPISGSLQLLNLTLMDFQSNTAEELHMYLEQIKQELSNANNLLEELLAWAKVQFKSLKMDPVEITNPKRHIQKSIDNVIPMANKKNISISMEIEDNLTFIADSGMLDAIFRNLLTNAIKFTNINGSIKIKAHYADNGVEFAIADNGIGMTTAQIGRLFKKSSTYTTYGTSGEKGTGLGLNLCHDFALKHGGDLWVKSEPGAGSTFFFTIPKINPHTISHI
jgi:PAS domain S-box-containing protein